MEAQAKDSPGRVLPIDLLIHIFSRVPAKILARFRCLSKSWRSILSQPGFKDLCLTTSYSHRRMFLFTIEDKNNIYFFSAPEIENPDQKTCLIVPATRYRVQKKHSPNDSIHGNISSVHGFVVLETRDTIVICNPVTGQSISLPELEPEFQYHGFTPLLGYDPIDNQFQVLGDLNKNYGLVLTLDNEDHIWRRNQCQHYYHPQSNGICIDGVLYYYADRFNEEKTVSTIVCFHVRSNKFSFINIEMFRPTLITYKGKLAAIQFEYFLNPSIPCHLELWVLEDAEKHIWSQRSYTLPRLLKDIIDDTAVHILGMTGRGEVVLASYPQTPLYICYFNLKTKHITRIHIQELEEFENCSKIHTCLGYAENLKLMCPALRLG